MRETRNTQKKRNTRSIVIVGLLLLLVAVIGFGGYTLSKYVTKKSGAGSATVAKWGFTVTSDDSKIFGDKYKFEEGNSVVTSDGNLTVNATSKVLAPGTTGSMTFSIKGSAEVLAQIEIKMTITSDVVLKYTKNGVAQDDYAPVKWTLKKGETVMVNGDTLDAVKTALNKTEEYKPNGTTINEEYELSWAWDFSTDDAHDELDTLLGMYANNTANTTNGDYAVVADGTNTTVAFTLDISITQLQQA